MFSLPPRTCWVRSHVLLSSRSLPSRYDSCSTSERSLEQASSDDVFVDCPPPAAPAGSGRLLRCGSGSQKVLSLRPQATLTRSRDSTGLARDCCSSPLPEMPLNATIRVDKNQGLLPYEATEHDLASCPPPPRPPKPSHLSERRQEQPLAGSVRPVGRPESAAVPRRVSLSGLENVGTWKGKWRTSACLLCPCICARMSPEAPAQPLRLPCVAGLPDAHSLPSRSGHRYR